MALVTISGFPASGKTRRAEQLQRLLKQKMEDPAYGGPHFKVVVLSDDSLHIKREVYNGEFGVIIPLPASSDHKVKRWAERKASAGILVHRHATSSWP